MNLNDPFGRIAAQRKAEYEVLYKALREQGVDTPEAVCELMVQVRQRTAIIAMTVSLVIGILALLFPSVAILIVVFGVIVLLWLVTTHVKNRQLIARYRDELKDRTEGD